MGRVSLCSIASLLQLIPSVGSEDVQMDQDDAPKEADDEMEKYKLDEYDKESSSIGAPLSSCFFQVLNCYSCWPVQ